MKKRIAIPTVLVVAAGAAIYAFRGGGRDASNRMVVSGNQAGALYQYNVARVDLAQAMGNVGSVIR